MLYKIFVYVFEYFVSYLIFLWLVGYFFKSRIFLLYLIVFVHNVCVSVLTISMYNLGVVIVAMCVKIWDNLFLFPWKLTIILTPMLTFAFISFLIIVVLPLPLYKISIIPTLGGGGWTYIRNTITPKATVW